ncbi:MAG: PAS domain S-box protein [Azospirillaceae bacterium]
MVRSSQSIVDLFKDALVGVVHGSRDFEILDANDAFCRMVDRPVDEVRGRRFIDLTVEGDREKNLDLLHRLLAGEQRGFVLEKRFHRPDGEEVWVCVNVSGVFDDAGALTSLCAIVEDISERIERERSLRQANDLLRIAGRTASIGGWSADLNAATVTLSDEACDIHGIERGRMLTFEDSVALYAPEWRERLYDVMERLNLQGTRFDEEMEVLAGDGDRRWVRVIGEPVHDEQGRVVRVQGALQDISRLKKAEADRRAFARQLNQSLESMSDAFYLLSGDWTFVYLNNAAERLLQRSREGLIGKSVWEEFPAARDTMLWSEYHRLMGTGETTTFEHFDPTVNRWFSVTPYDTGNGLAVYFRDVTEQRRATAQMRLLESSIAHLEDIVLITEAQPIDDPGPRIIFVNAAFERMTGYRSAEVIGKSPRFLQGPLTDRGELHRIRAALVAEKPVRAEVVNYTKDGTPFWLELDIVPVADETGRTAHFVAIERDVSERKRIELALRESDERFRLVSQVTNDVVWDWDLGRNVIWWSEGMRTVLGHDPAALSPSEETWLSLVHPDDRDRVRTSTHGALSGDDVQWADEYRMLKADGSWALVADRGFIRRDAAGKAVRMIGSMTDITEQREMQERLRQAQRLEAVGQLTGGIAHDFNNLLTVIMGNAEILVDSLEEGTPLHALARVSLTAAERGADLTGRLLAFARQQALKPQTADANRLIEEMAPLLRRTLGENIEIATRLATGIGAAYVDVPQFENAMLNLCINARDAMPAGGRLVIETGSARLDEEYAAQHADVKPGNYVSIAVSDTGTGMSPAVLERAFEPFFTTKAVGKGSGLGLSMVFGFMKQSNGHVRIYSERGHGTTVRLYLPHARASGAGDGDIRPAEPAATGRGEHILVVEDDEVVRRYVTGQLEALGYRVTSAANAGAAIDLLHGDTHVDLLFTDVVMAGAFGGRELADKAAVIRPGLPVLFTSGYAENAIVHQGRLDDGVLLLQKPYRRQELADMLRRAIEHGTPGYRGGSIPERD